MKKYLILAFAGLFSVTILLGETELKGTDLLFLNNTNLALYPEIDYINYPAILTNISSPFILNNLEFEAAFTDSVKTRIDDSIGAKDGTETTSFLKFAPNASFTAFFPLENTKTFGFDIKYDSEHIKNRITRENYNAVSENHELLTQLDIINIGADLYYALAVSEVINMGFSLGYNLNYTPKLFRWITDSTFNPSLVYVDVIAISDPVDKINHGINGAVGINFPLEKLALSFGVIYRGLIKDRSNEYVAVDSDADGYKDKLYTIEDYYLLEAGVGGPVDNVTGFSHENYAVTTNIDITVSALVPFSEKMTFIANGRYSVLGYTYDHYSKHILTDLVLTDESYYDQIYNSGLGSFDVLIGLDFKNLENTKNFRIGIGYSRFAETYTQNGDSIVGLNLFNNLNPDHYTELSLGINPQNDSIINSDLYPAFTEIHEFKLNARYQWMPVQKFTLYFDFAVSGYYNTKTYRAFNLDTFTVWEEKYVAAELSWKIDTLIGMAFLIGEKLTFTVDLQNLSTIGDVSASSESHAYDITMDRYSENGSNYLLSDTGLNLTLNLGLLVSW